MITTRNIELHQWLHNKCNSSISLSALNNDASFRKYYRFNYNNHSLVAVDSPPDKENNKAFIAVQKILASQNVKVPNILDLDMDNGYFIIEDFGNELLLPNLLKTSNPQSLYKACLNELIKIQGYARNRELEKNYNLPLFDNKLLSYEFDLFRNWFLDKYLSANLSENENELLDSIYQDLVHNVTIQPQVLVHRDYHSRNLLILDNNKIGVIDFQDAVWGPITYDLVSLYRDCYIAWPLSTVKEWVYNFFLESQKHNILDLNIDFEQYWVWFLKMTLQRNFKTIGIFSRLFLRDNKSGYLADIPRTLNYALETTKELLKLEHSVQLIELDMFLSNKVLPLLNNMQKR